jgi:hypothetical protein
MKAYQLLAPLGFIALAGCSIGRPVAYEPVVTTAPVAVAPTYVYPAATVVVGEAPVLEGEGVTLSR